MNLTAVPAELRARRQWVIWRSVINKNEETGQTSITKPPFDPNNPGYMADVKKPETWGSFEDAVRVFENNPSLVQGIGFVFTSDDEFFGIDVDDEEKVKPEHLAARRSIVNDLLSRADTYTEVSPSGKGLHIIGRGKMPISGKRSTAIQLEVYGAERYFTITGNVYAGRATITDQQALVDMFAQHFGNNDDSASVTNLGDIATHRRLDLSDEEVIREATNYNPMFAPRFNAQTGCGPGEWSETFMMIVGVLDQITGKVEQLQRIVMNSPMVLQASASSAGESRKAKAERNFAHVLSRVRRNNTAQMSAVNHGRSIMEAINAKREETAKKNAEEILKKSEEGFSKNGVELLKAFPLRPEHLALTPPPGIVGQFCEATAAATHNPFPKFAIPSTLATLTGLVGRAYKLPNGSGLNINVILAAATSTGKTQTMDAWEHFLNRAARGIENSLSGPSRNRIIKASASSIQGIFDDFMQMPSCVWYISECASQLAQMSNPKSTTDGQMRDAYNDLYDASKVGRMFSPPRSVAAKKGNLAPVENLSVSTYWTTTTSKFDVFNDDAQDGFLSRVVIIRHAGRAGEAVPDWDVAKNLDDELNQRLVNVLAMAKRFDEACLLAPNESAKHVTIVSTGSVEGQVWAYRQIAERVKNASLDGTLPMAYTAVSRLPMTALRLAAMLAVMDNPYSPSITVEQFEWSFGYLLQNTAALLSDMDTGELGATMSKDVEVVIREMKRSMRKTKVHGVKRSDLMHTLKQLKPFKDAMPTPGEAVKRTLTEMLALDLLVETTVNDGTRGRPHQLLSPTDDGRWS